MNAKKLLSICLALVLMFSIVACDGGNPTSDPAEHTHTPAENWSSNDESHWHACQDSSCTEKLDLASHTYDDGEVTKEATCDAEGEKTFTCTACGAIKVEKIPALTHEVGNTWEYDDTEHWQICGKCNEKCNVAVHQWTLDEEKSTEAKNAYFCAVCGITREEANQNHAHNYGKYESDEEGHWLVCTTCGEKTEKEAHTVDRWQQDAEKHWHVCSVCEVKVDEAAHDMQEVENGKKCADCEYFVEKDWNFTLNDLVNVDDLKLTFIKSTGEEKVSTGALYGIYAGYQYWQPPVDMWSKSDSVRFYAKLQMSAEDMRALLNAGYTTFNIGVRQRELANYNTNLTSVITADWTDASYTINTKNNYVNLTFSLKDLYDHYDAINNHEMALLKFHALELSTKDGGFTTNGSDWVSSYYYLVFRDFRVEKEHIHSYTNTYGVNDNGHYRVCGACGAQTETEAHTLGSWEKDSENHWKTCSVCKTVCEKAAHDMQETESGTKCAICEYALKKVESLVLNDMKTKDDMKLTFVTSNGVEKGPSKIWHGESEGYWCWQPTVDAWVKSNSVRFFIKLQMSKEDMKALLDMGYTTFSIGVKQRERTSDNANLTNNITADWTDVTYTINTKDKFVDLEFSLQDLYDHYDAINNGEMALLNLHVKELHIDNGGYTTNGSDWVSSYYCLVFRDFRVNEKA